ncbi:uncharacterized protein Triagg1_6376 [Trichoderma aggressivum f. europaeum]|uniref:Uncharacterized protein n=1 Tax=Trichoderma aggressivum f. europaeum TaxID=173218 RepID=A0AAE1IF63_9HYPO|nr:hypothetical protein Triagg1_6376 [Trichoderma aggressivum f. europaeum]
MAVTLNNTTDATFKINGYQEYLHNPPQEINPGDEAEIKYTPGKPTVIYCIDEEIRGQLVVEVGNSSQGNKLWGEGLFQLQMSGRAETWDIVTN